MTFATPVTITANTTYVASYYAPNGRYSVDSSATSRPPASTTRRCTRWQDGVDGGNGVYRYGTGGGFPTSTFQSTNYWVDVVFQPSAGDTTAPTVTATSPAAGATGVADHGADVTATFSESIQPATVAGPGDRGRRRHGVRQPPATTREQDGDVHADAPRSARRPTYTVDVSAAPRTRPATR